MTANESARIRYAIKINPAAGMGFHKNSRQEFKPKNAPPWTPSSSVSSACKPGSGFTATRKSPRRPSRSIWRSLSRATPSSGPARSPTPSTTASSFNTSAPCWKKSASASWKTSPGASPISSSRTSSRRASLDQLPESLPRHRPPAPGHEDEVARALFQQRGPRLLRIARKPGERLLSERYQALLRALAEDAHHAHVEAHFGEFQARELRDAQPARVEHFQHRPVAKPELRLRIRMREQRLHVGLGERPGKARRLLRRIEL